MLRHGTRALTFKTITSRSPQCARSASFVLRSPLTAHNTYRRRFATAAVTPVADDQDSHPDFKPTAKASTSDTSKLDEIRQGDPESPRCGYSANVVKVLQYLRVPFSSRDVISDPALRDAVKKYSDWPTLPQLYVKGEFVGGSDIVYEMFKKGELQKLLKEQGIAVHEEAHEQQTKQQTANP